MQRSSPVCPPPTPSSLKCSTRIGKLIFLEASNPFHRPIAKDPAPHSTDLDVDWGPRAPGTAHCLRKNRRRRWLCVCPRTCIPFSILASNSLGLRWAVQGERNRVLAKCLNIPAPPPPCGYKKYRGLARDREPESGTASIGVC